ncbi:MAG: sulfatase-like hydrolase/transferase [Oscillospiraceae bacterium]|nr:sulfatase-like hydrolase/transferase [Oscillospiraceae bacterium]
MTNANISFIGPGLFRCLFSSLAMGSALWLVTTMLPWKDWGRGIAAGVLFLLGAAAIAECCVQDFFGTYYQISYMFGMSGQVAGDFLSEAMGVIVKHLWFFPLALAPGILAILFRSRVVPKHTRRFPRSWLIWVLQAIVLVLAQLLNVLFCHVGGNTQYYTTDYSANSAIPRYGMVNTLRLEIQYGIFGQPTLKLGQDELLTTGTEGDGTATETETSETETAEETEEVEIVYEDNVLDIDFDALIASDTNDTLLAMDQYFSSQTPTKQNEYTGLFEGKNLIFITAEAFSYAVIDEERTPTLYMLANSGFVFTNYYQPNWTQSTTGGEFAAMTGLIPTWVNGGTSFVASASNSMPFGLGWMFQTLGYTTTAYHNNSYTYYSRNETHPNLGYDFIGIGLSGLPAGGGIRAGVSDRRAGGRRYRGRYSDRPDCGSLPLRHGGG